MTMSFVFGISYYGVQAFIYNLQNGHMMTNELNKVSNENDSREPRAVNNRKPTQQKKAIKEKCKTRQWNRQYIK